jgi:hypothetical protein
MSTVQQFGGNTTIVSNGSTAWGWNDVNNNGAVDKDDVVTRFKQADASVFTYVVGRGEGLYTWGDPHIDNVTFKSGAESGFVAAISSLMTDAKDGAVDDWRLLGSTDSSFHHSTNRAHFADFHADAVFTLGDGRTTIEHDVERIGKVALTDNIDWNARDARGAAISITVKNIWTGGGAGGKSGMTIADTTGDAANQAIQGPADLPNIREAAGANVYIGMYKFGADSGTKRSDAIVTAEGIVDSHKGKFTMEAINMFEASYTPARVLDLAFILGDFAEEEKQRERARAANAPKVL